MNDKPILIASQVGKSYEMGGRELKALSSITLSLFSGEFVGIWGPSGCGKSTLLSVLGLVLPPTEGRVVFMDKEVDYQSESLLTSLRRTSVGFIFQQFNLLPTLTASENIMLSLKLLGVKTSKAKDSAAKLLSSVGLGDRAEHFPSELSGGEMQRVAVCRALAHSPALIVADEPTGSLDSTSGEAVLSLLQDAAKNGAAILMATHSATAIAACSRTFALKDGREARQV